jgi:transcriptional regulator with XRE-family HTH domain
VKTVIELLDAAKAAIGVESDNALAIEMGYTRGAVSNWRNGKAYPDEIACAKLADMVGLPLHQVLGAIGEQRAISREAKAVWRRLATAATVAALCVMPYYAQAHSSAVSASPVPGSVYYVN